MPLSLRRCIRFVCFFVLSICAVQLPSFAQRASVTGALHGQVADPSGAIIPGATVQLTSKSGQQYTAQTGGDGTYSFRNLPAGTYTLDVSVTGFSPLTLPGITIAAGSSRALNPTLQIAVQQQEVQVTAQSNTVDTSPENNVSAVVISGKNLDALSDDPDELQNQLTALAGPSAGPNGAQIFIDGFTGGQLPPKSSIREIRVNQNPFSAEYDKLGYGRVEIFTKPGSEKLHGMVQASGNDSAFNAPSPFAENQPPYYSYRFQGFLSDGLAKNVSLFFSVFTRNRQDQNIVAALTNLTCGPNGSVSDPVPAGAGIPCNGAYSNPNTRIDIAPRFDIGLSKNNTLTVRYHYNRMQDGNDGFGGLSLPSQAYNLHNVENVLQISDSQIFSPKFLNETRFQFQHVNNNETALNGTPSVFVQGNFNGGGNNSGNVTDVQNHYELQNYSTLTRGSNSMRFGARFRVLADSNTSTSGANGSYTFQSLGSFNTAAPQQFEVNFVGRPVAQATLFDAGLFFQNDWKVSPKFTFSYGLRYEAQNYIHDYSDFGPRIEFAYALGHGGGRSPAKTVLRAGYGWFYDRFDVANSFAASAATPYVIQTIHENGINQRDYIVKNPTFYGKPIPAESYFQSLSQASKPTVYNIDPHFHAALNMQAAVGVDQQLAKNITGNITYLYSKGVHHYLTDNINAFTSFDPATGLGSGRQCSLPDAPLGCPAGGYDGNVYQFQSGGVYNQSEVIASAHANYKRVNFFTFYVYNHAYADTAGATSFPSVQSDPGFDYGRASFDIENRFVLFGNFSLPYGVSLSPIFAANSGNPFDVAVGQDLNGDNQFNDRPAFAACGTPQAYSGPPGSNPALYRVNGHCFNISPTFIGQKPVNAIPSNYGTGPSNYSLNMRISKVIGIGPKVGRGGAGVGGEHHHGGGGLGARGLSGGGGGGPRLDQEVHRKYNISLVAYGANIFNHQNLATPDGVLFSQLFNTSQGLAGGFFSPHYPGNRSIDLEATFNF
jgi:hypothetical protein